MKNFLNHILGKTKKQEVVAEEKESIQKISVLNGQAFISGGKISITAPKEGGVPAKITVVDQTVTVLVNEEPVQGMVAVMPEDKIEVFCVDKEAQKELSVKIQPDEMVAYLECKQIRGEKISLSDHPPIDFLEIKANIEYVFPTPWKKKELELALLEAGVVQGIDQQILESGTAEQPEALLLVAKAKKAIPGKNAFIEYCFDQSAKIVSLAEGDLVARKHPAILGVEGISVKGNTLPVAQVADCEFLVGPGVIILPSGLEAVAEYGGKPLVKNGTVQIEPLQTLDGDITILKYPDGVSFKGNLVVTGTIEDGLLIDVGGNLLVKGGAVNAEILVGGSIDIQKSLIGSKIYSGRVHLAYEEILEHIKKIQLELKGILDNALQLKSKSLQSEQPITEEKIIKVLLSSRFPDFIKYLEVIERNFPTVQKYLSEELLGNLKKIIAYRVTPPKKIQELPVAYNMTALLMEEIKASLDATDCAVNCFYTQNSRIESSGNIHITGSGCYNSILISRKAIEVKGTPGIFRGGKAIAKEDIFIKELGCPSSAAPTHVEVPADKQIKASLIHAGVVLKIGEKIYRNNKDSREFEIYIDAAGKLQTSSLKAEYDE